MSEQIRPTFTRAGAENVALLFLLVILCASCGKPANNTHDANHNPAGGPSAAILNSNVVIRTVQVSPRLPAYRFVLTRNVVASDTPEHTHYVGQIDISEGNSTAVRQTIALESAEAGWLMESFHTLDINFDGYLDFAVVYEVGGKYSRESYWLFDPGSGRYVTNALTAELRELAHNGLTLDPQKNEIRTSHFIGVCLNSFQIFRVENDHLELMESEMHSPREPGRCLVEKRKRVNGELTLIESKERKHEISPSLRDP